MANKTFRRVLSIIMCAAMLVSVFAVSFTASATVTTDNDAGTITYDWDFTDTENGASYVTELKENSTFTPDDSGKLWYDSTGGYARIEKNGNATTAAFKTPTDYTPYQLTVESRSYTDGGDNCGAGAVVIGNISYGTKTAETIQAWVTARRNSDNVYPVLRIQRQGRSKPLVNEDLKVTYSADTSRSSTNYWGVFPNINVRANIESGFKYKYEATVNNDTVILNVTINYTHTDGNVYTAYADPIEINTDYLNTKANQISTEYSSAGGITFTPDCFGIARDHWGSNNKYYSDFCSVKAVYKKGCTHANQTTTPQKDPTCTEAGKTEEVTCDDCGAHISGGEVIKALGHDLPENWSVTKSATLTEPGEQERKCSRCDYVETEEIPALDGSVTYNWDYTTSKGESNVSDTLNNSEFVNSANKSIFTYNSEGYLNVAASQWYKGIAFKTPTADGINYTPSELTVFSQNTACNNYDQHVNVGAVIGETEDTGGTTRTLLVGGNFMYYGAKITITNKDWTMGNGFSKDYNLTFKNAEGSSLGNDFGKAMGVTLEKTVDAYSCLTYKYKITVDDDDNVSVIVTAAYTDPSTGTKYEATAEPVTINLEYLKTLDSTISGFTPKFGIAKYSNNNNAKKDAKLYSVKAKYAKGCNHENTHEEDEILAECLKPGREAGTYCDDCGKFILGGNVIAALGHDKGTTVKTVEPSCQDGYTLYKCSRCGTEYKDDITTKTGNHVASDEGTVVDPTCTEDGYTEYTCANCGEKFRDNATPKTGHGDWTWVVVKDPSKTEDGNRRFVCGKCGYWNGTNVDIKAVNFAVESTQVVLDGSINFKITVVANTYFDQNSLKLTINGEEYTVNNGLEYDSASSDGNYARYTVTITKFAHQMTDKYDLKFEGTAEASEGASFSQVLNCTDEKTDVSVASNLKNVYDKLTDEKDAATKTLIAKLANYGAAAQKYNALANGLEEIADADLANYFLDADDANKTTAEDAYTAMTNTADGKFYDNTKDIFGQTFKASLAIGLQTKIKMIVNVSDLTLEDGQTLWVRMDGVDQKLDNNNGVYSAAFGEFAPADYAANKTITLVVKDANGADVETSGEVTYSVGAYINRMAPKRANLKPLLNAITEYYNAATALS